MERKKERKNENIFLLSTKRTRTDRQTDRQRGRLCGSDTIDVIQTTFSTYENVMRELGGPHSSSPPTTYSKCIILSIYSSSSSGVGQAIESQAKGTTNFFLSLSLFIHLHVRIVPPGSRVSTEIRQYYYIPVHLLFFIICVIIGTSQRNAWHIFRRTYEIGIRHAPGGGGLYMYSTL